MGKLKLALRPCFMVLCLFFTAAFVQAQTGTIKGIVKDINGNPLNGASVSIEGQSRGATTDATGAFSIKVPPGSYTVVFTYVGQTPQKVTVTVVAGGTTEANANMAQMADLGAIQVVGSRSRLPRTVISTPVPVDVISAKEVKSFAQADVTQMLTYVAPSFQSARQTISDGTDHIDPAGLRGLGPDQTLVLLNGKRRHNTALVNINGTVGRGSVGTDLNAIPMAAIDRIEVLRDGAAAQYGSDAIAGVINVVLKRNYKGINFSAMAGENVTTMPYAGGVRINDGRNTQLDFSAGAAGKVGFINVSGQWLVRDRSNRSGNDNIPLVYLGNAGAFPATQPGVSTVDYRRFLMDEDRKIVQQRGYNRRNIYAGNSSANNFGVFVNGGIPFSSNAEAYFTAGSSHRTGFATGFSRNPNSVAQQPITSSGNRLYQDGFLPEIHTTINDVSFIAGVKFKVKAWEFDVSNTYGKNTIGFDIKNTGNASLAATDFPQTQFEAGKLGFSQNTANLDINRKFDFSSTSNINLAFGGEWRGEEFSIENGELNSYTNGGRIATVPELPSFPGTLGTSTTSGASVVPASGSQVFPGFQPSDAINATRNVFSGYADVEYTTGKLLLGLAGRYESYNETNVTYNGTGLKFTARYEVAKDIAVRGSVTTGFRAPSMHQRYFQNTSTQFVNGLPSNALTANNENKIVREAFGIDGLKPETSTSFTLGFVAKFGNGFTATVDGYLINIKDRIVLSTQFTRGNPLVNAILNLNNVDPNINALQFWTNAVDTRTKGIDVVLTKNYKLGKGGGRITLAGNFNDNQVVGAINTNSVIDAPDNNPSLTNANANPANDLRNALFDRTQRSRIEVAQPRSKINLTANYTIKKFDFLIRAVRFGETVLLSNVDPASLNSQGASWNDVALEADQTFKAKITTDLVVSLRACDGIVFSAGANNLFDVYPDRLFIDPRNDPQAVYGNPNNPVVPAGAAKSVGGYFAGRDLSNRGRFLFGANQFGFNGRFLFARVAVDVWPLTKSIKRMKKK
jgi:iron complex outermembrane recepter protein